MHAAARCERDGHHIAVRRRAVEDGVWPGLIQHLDQVPVTRNAPPFRALLTLLGVDLTQGAEVVEVIRLGELLETLHPALPAPGAGSDHGDTQPTHLWSPC